MSSSARLKYRIVKCTSEDPEYPVSELIQHTSSTKGWQTARFCDFPQEMGLQFETPVHLRQVQFLSHQSKIATKIELFTALPAEGLTARYETAQFKRLGYLSLDSNERSQFQARELKSVYVDVSAQFLKILFHKCHVNRYNIVNQVGLIALNCLGEHLGPDLAVGPPPPNPTLARGPEAQAQPQAAPSMPAPQAAPPQAPAAVVPQAAPAPQQSAAAAPAVSNNAAELAKDAAQDASDEMRFDARTLERLRALTAAKQRAVEVEDYEEAKRCKEMLARLRQTGLLLRELEDRKRSAVANEDYDAAKALKVEIDRLRNSIERPQQAPPPAADEEKVAVNDWGAPAAPQAAAATAGPRGAHQPVMAQAPGGTGMSGSPHMAGLGEDPAEAWASASGGRGGFDQGSSPTASSAGARKMGAGYGGGTAGPAGGAGGSAPGQQPGYYDTPPPAPYEGGAPSFGREGAGSPMLPAQQAQAGHAERRSPTYGGGVPPPLPGGAGGGAGGGFGGGASPQSGEAHPLAGVPNVEDLGQPDPIGAAFEKEAEDLVRLFGEYVTRCLYSKAWNLRDAAIQKLTLDLREGVHSNKNPSQLLEAFATILRRMIQEKNVQVFLSSASLLQMICEQLLDRGPLRRPEAQAALDPIMPLLVDRLGDANTRVEKTARDAHLDFARCAAVGAPFVAQYLLRPLKKKNPHARVYSSRLQLLSQLVSEVGVQPDSKDGLPLEPCMQLAMDWFSNPSSDVRENAVKLVAACYSHVGLQRIEKYLANLRQAQREVFDEAFEKVATGGSGAAPPQSASHRNNRGGGHVGRGDYEDDGLPQPAVPPPRAGGQQRTPAPASLEPEAYDDDEDGVADFTCQFCMRQDPSFTPEALDVHYWKECPMLTQCEFCQQVIEIMTLRAHLSDECEVSREARAAAATMPPNSCPLCRTDLGAAEDQDWKYHLLQQCCPRNPRTSGVRVRR